MRTTTIYALIDPNTNQCRYVGKTVNAAKRMIHHKHDMRKHNTRKVRWMKSIAPLLPELIVLEEVVENWQEAEQFWIACMKSLGADLTNHTLGGDGVSGFQISEVTRKRLSESHKGNKHSAETKLKMSLASKGKPKSNKHAENIRKGQKGKTVSDETRLLISQAVKAAYIVNPELATFTSKRLKGKEAYNKGIPMKEEQKLKVSEGLKKYFKNKRKMETSMFL